MTEWVEFIRLIASRGRWLVTVVIVAAIVFAIFQFSQISIDTPYVYLVYVIYLAGITCGVFLLTGMAIWVGQRIWTNLESRAEARAEDERALLNLSTIGYEHAEALCWIVRNMGERFWIAPYKIHYELIDHGFLVFDDEATRGGKSTYLKVRKVVWEKITSSDYKWSHRFYPLSSSAPWLNKIY